MQNLFIKKNKQAWNCLDNLILLYCYCFDNLIILYYWWGQSLLRVYVILYFLIECFLILTAYFCFFTFYMPIWHFLKLFMTCKKWIEHSSIEVKVLNIDYSTASVKEITRKQKQQVRTRKAKVSNTKLMSTKQFCRNFVKNLMVLKSTSKKELKNFVAKANYQRKR